jgi:hypothetical protein
MEWIQEWLILIVGNAAKTAYAWISAGQSVQRVERVDQSLLQSWRRFTYDEIRIATRNFSQDHLLAEGTFGRVYWGAWPDGTRLAVKQLKAGPKVQPHACHNPKVCSFRRILSA